MKTRILFLILLLAGCAGMQPIKPEEKTFTGIFEAPGFTKDQIYDSTNIWIAENFYSARSVIEYQNKNEGVIIGSAITDYPCDGVGCAFKADWDLAFTMRADIKDSKFKLTFSNLQHSDGLPIQYSGDLLHIKSKLLSYGDSIAGTVKKNAGSKDW